MKYVLTGGGTGGHVYPALAIKQIISQQDHNAEFLYIGIAGKAEQYIIENLNSSETVPLDYIHAEGLPRSLHVFRLLNFSLSLLRGFFKSISLLKRFKPDCIIATGGYVAAPVIFAGYFLRISIILFESNSIPGLVNKLLAKLADAILITFSETKTHFTKSKTAYVGYPVRKALEAYSKEKARRTLSIASDAKVVFVFGGSTGAQTINEAVVRNLEVFLSLGNLILIHGTGRGAQHTNSQKLIEDLYASPPPETKYRMKEYFHDINVYYSAADIIVCRAGSGTIMECAALGRPMVLIPKIGLPGDHQVKNAELVEKIEGGVLVKEEYYRNDVILDGELVANTVHTLISDTSRLLEMGKNIRTIYRSDTNERIAETLRSVLNIT